MEYTETESFIQQIIDRTTQNDIQWYHKDTNLYQCEIAGAKITIGRVHPESVSGLYRLRIEKDDCIVREYPSNFSSKVIALSNYVTEQVKSANEPTLRRIVDMIYKRNPVPITSTLEVNRET